MIKNQAVRALLTSCLLGLVLCSSANAKGPWRKLWRVSQYVTIGVNVADSHSSWGRREANPILGERFGTRAVAIKSGVIVAWLFIQRRTSRKGRNYKAFAITNYAVSGTIGAIAIYNYRTGR